MKVSTRERIVWMIIALLANLIGYKIGQRVDRKCMVLENEQKQSTQVKETIHSNRTMLKSVINDEDKKEPLCPSLVCPQSVCPPCDCKPTPKPRVRKVHRKKAPPVKASSPVDRQKLLAWVKKYSPRLKRCRDAGQPIYKLHTQITLNAQKDQILRVKVKGTDVPNRAIRCVELDLKKWPAPSNLSLTHPPLLIFGLQLD